MIAAETILATPPERAHELLGRGDAAITAFRRMARDWHPDVNRHPLATEVMSHLTALRARIDTSASAAPAGRTFRRHDGSSFVYRTISEDHAGFAEVLVGPGTVSYLYAPSDDDLAFSESYAVWRLKYADEAMEAEMSRFLPTSPRIHETVDGMLLAYHRPADTVLLSHLLAMTGPLDPEHAAWLLTRLLNIACYLEWAAISHGAIAPETLLVSPAEHGVVLTGGFGFATRFGEARQAIPERSGDLAPAACLPGVVADGSLDLELVLLTVRETLGAPSAGGLLRRRDVPEAMARFLALPAGTSAREAYARWESARGIAFRDRRFVDMNIAPSDVYGA